VRFVPPLAALLGLSIALAGCGEEEVERALPRPSPVQSAAALGAIAEAPAPPAVSGRSAEQEELERRYRRNDRARVPRTGVAPFLPLYRRAARHYDVPWRLLAAIHKQETAFSTAPGTYHGLNFAGCCAGPMQFNLKNKPVSTWKRFGNAYKIGPPRPSEYPNQTERHPSPYDDWDAILAAARLLAANGAGPELDGAAWTAAYLYYGPGDLTEDDFGVTYADEVLARALSWERRGFCPECTTPRGLVVAVHGKFAPPLAGSDETKEKRREAARKRRARRRRARERRERRERAERRAERRRAAARDRRADEARENQPSGAREEDRKARPDPPRQDGAGQQAPSQNQTQTQAKPPAQTQTRPPAQTTPAVPIPPVDRGASATQPAPAPEPPAG
jgi:hypothetical protein